MCLPVHFRGRHISCAFSRPPGGWRAASRPLSRIRSELPAGTSRCRNRLRDSPALRVVWSGLGRPRHHDCLPCSGSALTPQRPCWSPPGTTQTGSREASYAALLGASPIRAPSGKTKRKRLNRGGDRQGNSAVWHIVITRMSTQPADQGHVERRTTEGLSTSEIIRCLKRYVASEVFNALPQEFRT